MVCKVDPKDIPIKCFKYNQSRWNKVEASHYFEVLGVPFYLYNLGLVHNVNTVEDLFNQDCLAIWDCSNLNTCIYHTGDGNFNDFMIKMQERLTMNFIDQL